MSQNLLSKYLADEHPFTIFLLASLGYQGFDTYPVRIENIVDVYVNLGYKRILASLWNQWNYLRENQLRICIFFAGYLADWP